MEDKKRAIEMDDEDQRWIEEERQREIEDQRRREMDPVAIYVKQFRCNDDMDRATRTKAYLDGKISPEILSSDQFDLELVLKAEPGLHDHDNDDDYLKNPEGREEISNLAKFAINEHNKSIQQSGIKYVFEDVLSVTWTLAEGFQHYITFTAMEIDNKGGEPKLRTIKAGVFDKEIDDYTLEYFEVISDSKPEGAEDKITVQP